MMESATNSSTIITSNNTVNDTVDGDNVNGNGDNPVLRGDVGVSIRTNERKRKNKWGPMLTNSGGTTTIDIPTTIPNPSPCSSSSSSSPISSSLLVSSSISSSLLVSSSSSSSSSVTSLLPITSSIASSTVVNNTLTSQVTSIQSSSNTATSSSSFVKSSSFPSNPTIAVADVIQKSAGKVSENSIDASINSGADDSNIKSSSSTSRFQLKKPRLVIKSIKSMDSIASLQGDDSNPTISNDAPVIECTGDIDEKGYYRCKISETLGQRYRVMSILGQGVFASVVRCLPIVNNDGNGRANLVAIKILRRRAHHVVDASDEIALLWRIQRYQQENGSHHVIDIIESFYHAEHPCLVFENMHSNLRAALRKQYPGGMPLPMVQLFGRQLFQALRLISGLGYVHLDIKPDNILVDERMTNIKVCDFGSALGISQLQDKPLGSYLVARLYRPPELLMQCGPRTYAIDVWSAAVTICELIRGSILFTGKTSNEVMWNIFRSIGPPSKKLLKQCSAEMAESEARSQESWRRRHHAVPQSLSMGGDGENPSSTSEVPLELTATVISGPEPWIEPDGSGWFIFSLYRTEVVPGTNADNPSFIKLPIPTAPATSFFDLLQGAGATGDTNALMRTFAADLTQLLNFDPSKRPSAKDALLLTCFK